MAFQYLGVFFKESLKPKNLLTASNRKNESAALKEVAIGGVIGVTDRALVSSDLRARPESIVMACPETRVTAGGLLRVFGWYDNEWGFSCRMLDVARLMG